VRARAGTNGREVKRANGGAGAWGGDRYARVEGRGGYRHLVRQAEVRLCVEQQLHHLEVAFKTGAHEPGPALLPRKLGGAGDGASGGWAGRGGGERVGTATRGAGDAAVGCGRGRGRGCRHVTSSRMADEGLTSGRWRRLTGDVVASCIRGSNGGPMVKWLTCQDGINRRRRVVRGNAVVRDVARMTVRESPEPRGVGGFCSRGWL
jgi:hypothetical protein